MNAEKMETDPTKKLWVRETKRGGNYQLDVIFMIDDRCNPRTIAAFGLDSPWNIEDQEAIADMIQNAPVVKRQRDELLRYSKEVMDILEKRGSSIIPHLLDTDDNPGQRLRMAIANAETNQ